jgi:glycerate kinase
MAAFFGDTLQSGSQIVMDTVGLADRLAKCELCITGEGRLDSQSLEGKVVAAVAEACKKTGVPCYALAGSIDPAANFRPLNLAASIALGGDGDPERSRESIAAAAREIIFQIGET